MGEVINAWFMYRSWQHLHLRFYKEGGVKYNIELFTEENRIGLVYEDRIGSNKIIWI